MYEVILKNEYCMFKEWYMLHITNVCLCHKAVRG